MNKLEKHSNIEKILLLSSQKSWWLKLTVNPKSTSVNTHTHTHTERERERERASQDI